MQQELNSNQGNFNSNSSNNFNNQSSNYPNTRDKSFQNFENNATSNFNNASAMNTFDSISQANANALEITALQKSNSQVTGYQLSNGQIVNKQQAISMAKNGEIKNVGVATNQGTEYLRSLPDGTQSNNLDNLPTVTN